MSTPTARTLSDRASAVMRQVRALTRDPWEWDVDDLLLLDAIKKEVDLARDRAIAGLREIGTTDREIADALGVTQQAVSKRWPGGGRYVGAAGRYRQPNTPTEASE